MPESAEQSRPGRLTFRLKILLALLAVILLMAGILLFVLQRETSAQIETAIHAAVGKSRADYQELEKTWKDEPSSLCKRFANSTRILGAFDAPWKKGMQACWPRRPSTKPNCPGFQDT